MLGTIIMKLCNLKKDLEKELRYKKAKLLLKKMK